MYVDTTIAVRKLAILNINKKSGGPRYRSGRLPHAKRALYHMS